MYEADVYRADPLTGDAERLPLEGVTELCAWEGGLLAVTCDVEKRRMPPCVGGPGERGGPLRWTSGPCRGSRAWPATGTRSAPSWTARCPCGTARAGRRCRATRPAIWTTPLRWWARATRPLGTNDMQYVPFTEAGSLPTLTIRGYISADNIDAGFPAGLSRRGRITRRRPLTYGAAGGRGHRRRR